MSDMLGISSSAVAAYQRAWARSVTTLPTSAPKGIRVSNPH